MEYDGLPLLSITHILLLQTSCAALLCQASLRLVHVLLLLSSSLAATPLHYLQLDLHLITYETSQRQCRSSSRLALIQLSLVLLRPSLPLSPLDQSPPSLDPISKIHLRSAIRMVDLSVSLESGYTHPSLQPIS